MVEWNPRANELFLQAVQLTDLQARQEFLDRECAGDIALRSEIETLLTAHEQAGKFLEQPHLAVGQAAPDLTGAFSTHKTNTPTEHIGQVIADKYKLVQEIGEGGMGSVFLADQLRPVKRRVAIKVIKAGMDSAVVLARFEAERQALALMDHPNIAKVLDAGTTDAGRPFFVMELVKGVPITQYCDQRKLTPRERLELFVPVCHAIQHAHQKGIIHRDIKPSNVLIALYDDKPVPKVIDFGIAKATGQALTENPHNTGFGGVVGTPQYMSPEQASLNNLDIDTRSDVYSLGILLYELLTGSPPFKKQELEKAAFLEILRIVREDEPPKPSTKLSTADALPSLSANRGTEPNALTRILRNELDWIVMKALEKDRTRRYETANGFAADVLRYLSGEAVLAHPPSQGYRLKKFLQKNRGPMIAASLVAIALVAGMIGTSIGLVRAEARAKEARESAEAERLAKTAEAEQRKAAELSNQQAFEALKSFTDDLMGKVLGTKDKLTENEKAILRNAQKQWEVFAQSKGDSAEARVIRSEGAAELALVQYKLGMNVEAEANDRAALSARTSLATDFPNNSNYRLKQAMSHQNLGASLRGNGNRAEAEENFKQAVEIFKRLAADFPDEQQYRRRLGWSLISLGNAKRGRADWAAAELHYREALIVQKKLADESARVASYRDDESDSHWGLAFTLKRAGRLVESEVEYRQALELKEKLAAEFPAETSYRHQSANLGRELGVFLYDNGKDDAGAKLFPKAIGTLDQLAAEFPSMPIYRSDLSRCRRDYGKVLGYLKKPVEGAEQFRKAVALGERLVADSPTVLPYQADLGLAYSYLANLLRDGDTAADSLEWYGKAIRTLTAAYEQDRQVILTKNALYKTHADRAKALDRLGKHADALLDWDKSLELCPLDTRDTFRFQRVDSRLRSGQVAEAIAEVGELAKIESANPDHWFNFARLYSVASGKVANKKQEYTERAMELLQKAVKAGYKDAAHMAKDTDLDPLRGREDFKKLMAELEKKK